MQPKYIVIHTAAYTGRNCDAEMIDRWHKRRGWSGIGYHYVILNDLHHQKADGSIERGRLPDRQGAHARGLNSQSLGICCIGHGDYSNFTSKQYESLYKLIKELTEEYQIPVSRVIGHREINNLVDSGIIDAQYRTQKSCPGRLINMDAIRQVLAGPVSEGTDTQAENDLPSDEGINTILETLALCHPKFPNAQDELNEFLNHPEVIEFRDRHHG